MQHVHDYMFMPDEFVWHDLQVRDRVMRNRKLFYGGFVSAYVMSMAVAVPGTYGIAGGYPEAELIAGGLLSAMAWKASKKLFIDGEVAQAAYMKAPIEKRARQAEARAAFYPAMIEITQV
jgi:hypothetical protein